MMGSEEEVWMGITSLSDQHEVEMSVDLRGQTRYRHRAMVFSDGGRRRGWHDDVVREEWRDGLPKGHRLAK